MTRRTLLQQMVATGVAALPQTLSTSRPEILNPANLKRFVDALPIPPLAKPVGQRPSPDGHATKIPFFSFPITEFRASVHRDLPPTTMWGYNGSSPGPTFEAHCGAPFLVEWRNELPTRHLLAVDHSIHGAEASKPDVRTVVHLHGGRTPPQFDGHPELWFTPGHSFTYFYPNQQESTTLFYHDHAMGITRLNTLAGLMGLYLVRDETEAQLNLPSGRFEIPLIFCDRTFTTDGQFHYSANWVAEFIGNAILINGKIFPYLEVEPRAYRFRVLNASNGGFYYLSLSKEGAPARDAEPLWQVGSDQGLLAAPVRLTRVFLAPGERADLIIDFRPFAGENVMLNAQSG